MRTYRILVVDDSPAFQQAACDLLSDLPGVEVVGRASSASEVLRLADRLAPDLVVTDLEMPGLHRIDLARSLAATAAHHHNIIISVFY